MQQYRYDLAFAARGPCFRALILGVHFCGGNFSWGRNNSLGGSVGRSFSQSVSISRNVEQLELDI